MSRTDSSATEPAASLLGWLGFRGAKPDGGEAAGSARPAVPGAGVGNDLGKQARRELMAAITAFLLDNDLALTPDNLLLAHGAFCGANPRLARQIAARVEAGEPVTQEWLDEISATQKHDNSDLERLIARLESNLDGFSKATRSARTATTKYNAKLEEHVAELDEAGEAGQIISNLTDLAKAMLSRTRKVEDEMRRSEEEAKALRQSLARAKRDAELDHLTGLPNRRAFEALLDRHYREARAAIEPLCVAFCDIDHFKRINDTHGHDTGDRVIQAIAESLALISNDNCHVARHGGEEFVMLFRGSTLAEAQVRLDETRARLSSRNFVNRKTDEDIGQITFSGGVADVFAYADPRAALRAADEALYRAKQAGRNRVERA